VVSSAEAVILTGDIENWLDIRLDPTLAWEHPNIRATARHLAQQLAAMDFDGQVSLFMTRG
jgi:acyl carrier protein